MLSRWYSLNPCEQASVYAIHLYFEYNLSYDDSVLLLKKVHKLIHTHIYENMKYIIYNINYHPN